MILKSLGIQMDLVDISGKQWTSCHVMSRADFVLHSARHGRPEGRDEGKCQEEGGTETRPPASDI